MTRTIMSLACLLVLTACAAGSGIHDYAGGPALAAMMEERQRAVVALEAAQSNVVGLATQYATMEQSDEEDEAQRQRIAQLRQAIAAMRSLIEMLEAQLDALDVEITALAGDGGEVVAEPPSFAAAAYHSPVVVVERADDFFFFATEDYIHIGADAAPDARLAGAGSHGNATIAYGSVTDGVSKERLVSYLQADAAAYTTDINTDGFIRRFGEGPPTVAIVEGATAGMIEETRQAVRILNAALPPHWQLGFSAQPQPNVLEPGHGALLVEFIPRTLWPGTHPENAVGVARYWLDAVLNPNFDPETAGPEDLGKAQIATISSGRVWIDHTAISGEQRMETLVHELIHTLGRGHADSTDFPLSVMVGEGLSNGKQGHVLQPLDRDALLAVYDRLPPHTLPGEVHTELGPWETTGLQIRGRVRYFDDATFGVTLRNGVAEPWAFGPEPDTALKDNTLLSFRSSATWTGRLLGFTPQTEVVGGQAEMVVDLLDLDGELSFTSLEHWLPRSAPGVIGSGFQWGDGDLRYFISVEENGFVNTGGEEGTVTGAFFGDYHYLMGGTLERADLSAAFGGKR